MSITNKMRECFENLMKPLVTNENLEQKFKPFQDGRLKKLKIRLRNKMIGLRNWNPN